MAILEDIEKKLNQRNLASYPSLIESIRASEDADARKERMLDKRS